MYHVLSYIHTMAEKQSPLCFNILHHGEQTIMCSSSSGSSPVLNFII